MSEQMDTMDMDAGAPDAAPIAGPSALAPSTVEQVPVNAAPGADAPPDQFLNLQPQGEPHHSLFFSPTD